MNLTRLMALGTLARYGPQHGHQIRRLADVTNVGEWGGVSAGALYRELRAMEREGLVAELRTEQVGRRPARTVYAITADGRLELASLRTRVLMSTEYGPDAVGVALTFAVDDMDREELREILRARRDRLAISRRELAAWRERGVARGYISPMQSATMRRGELHIEAEVRWHDELDAALAAGAPLGGNAALAAGAPLGGNAARRGRVTREAHGGAGRLTAGATSAGATSAGATTAGATTAGATTAAGTTAGAADEDPSARPSSVRLPGGRENGLNLIEILLDNGDRNGGRNRRQAQRGSKPCRSSRPGASPARSRAASARWRRYAAST
ncbi:MAG TPA: PadR family transcriptional regulator [Trebonia sp.]|nr:PadR family transcriptional regulator [Trebonia sp.]